MNEIISILQEHEAFVIAGHRDPDGDSLGSAMALALGLEQIDKRAVVVSADTVSSAYSRLPEMERVQRVSELPDGYPVAILVECSSIDRSGLGGFEGRLVVNIDHHAKNPAYGDVNWIEPDVAALGVMIYRLLEVLGVEITPEIATHLYVAILTDTGSFRFSNTDSHAFRVCADLVDRGVDPAEVAEIAYGDVPAAKARLLGAALSSLELERGGGLATMLLPHASFREYPGDPDTEGIVNHAQAIEGVHVSLLFKELEPGQFRVSLRSDASADVASVAARFGGGGHPRAAGCSLSGDLEEVKDRLFRAIDEELARRAGTS